VGRVWGDFRRYADQRDHWLRESKAERDRCLAESVTTEATVIRNGQKVSIPSQELVPGDLVLLAGIRYLLIYGWSSPQPASR